MRKELKKLRIDENLYQSEMAKKCGVSRTTYGKIENGERDGSFSFWATLQNEFNVPNEEMWKLQKDYEVQNK